MVTCLSPIVAINAYAKMHRFTIIGKDLLFRRLAEGYGGSSHIWIGMRRAGLFWENICYLPRFQKWEMALISLVLRGLKWLLLFIYQGIRCHAVAYVNNFTILFLTLARKCPKTRTNRVALQPVGTPPFALVAAPSPPTGCNCCRSIDNLGGLFRVVGSSVVEEDARGHS